VPKNHFQPKVPAAECFESAYGNELAAGEYLDVGFADHYSVAIQSVAVPSPPH
jgi:hypothetical protein